MQLDQMTATMNSIQVQLKTFSELLKIQQDQIGNFTVGSAEAISLIRSKHNFQGKQATKRRPTTIKCLEGS